MDSDGELRLTIMATLAQEESRKKNNGHTIQRGCVTVIYIRGSQVVPHVAHTAATMRKKELCICDKRRRNCLVELCKNKKVVDIYGHSVHNNEDEIQRQSCIIIMQHIRRRQP